MKPYVSIDIETTGLNPDTDQILEIGAVWEDWTTPLNELKTFRCLVQHDNYHGSAYALALNVKLLKELAGPWETSMLEPHEVGEVFNSWLKGCGWNGKENMTAAGKNFASFDRQFLRKLPCFDENVYIKHRAIDPAMLFWLPGDNALPDSKTCYERAGMSNEVAHTAVEDALAVVQLIRIGTERLWKSNELKRLDPSVSIWPPTLVDEPIVTLTGADWNTLVTRIEALEVGYRPDSLDSNEASRS
jgi:oligoribonuclease (3'-5' exoribonuclease)